MIRVFLVDDHEIVRRGIARLVDVEPELEVVGESATVRGTLDRVQVTHPDVVVLDLHLPDGTGIDLCRSIRSAHPAIRCLILTADDDESARVAAVIAGASGHVLKSIRGGRLVEAILRIARGESLIPENLAERVHRDLSAQALHARRPRVSLTLREQQVLKLITEGLTNRQIGQRLGLAEKTVKNYVSGLLAKLGMERRTQVAAYGAATQDSAIHS
ncbi:response regulator transcription factor [Nesterenkonia sp. LB17]|uniref:response regulator n=1 Tax=Nesterenkonia sp. LB17 TaxID=2901230 RepID=UPI001F4D0982|nr:response regulator transcription factor [Nesterenkonia sp. LB17]MCH8566430.1 response regulator transcription factor [Nesterenkonia sp. LB17]